LTVKAQIHLWPWSVEVAKDSLDLLGGEITIPFFGSPVISLSEGASLILPSRSERFVALGPSYESLGGRYRVYETPHGVLAGPKVSTSSNTLSVLEAGLVREIAFRTEGAAERVEGKHPDGTEKLTPIARHVLAWSQFFDDLIDIIRSGDIYADGIQWPWLLDLLNELSVIREPRMALIVKIAQDLRRQLPEIVLGIRRILLRERELIPMHRVQESDIGCLRWYVRQPGRTAAEKAGTRQKLLAVVRREIFDTLENRILKEFIRLCRREAYRYLQDVVGSDPKFQSATRSILVRSFREVCRECLRDPTLEAIRKPGAGIAPNNVLLNDPRYRQVWAWYLQLLRHEEEQDRVWDWQSRMWADVVRLMAGAALELWRTEEGHRVSINGLTCRTIVDSGMRVTLEQRLGCRIESGSEPGPFLIERFKNGRMDKQAVLELVHPSLAQQHNVSRMLGRTGGHLYFVISDINGGSQRQGVIILWAVNTAASTAPCTADADYLSRSAFRAIETHRTVLGLRGTNVPKISGLVVANCCSENGLGGKAKQRAERHDAVANHLPVLIVPADPNGWESAVEELAQALIDVFGEIIG